MRQLPAEVTAWQLRCEELAAEGVEDWRTEVVGGNGQNAGEFSIMVALRRYQAACKENARKENGVRAFARLEAIAVAEDDMDATTRYIGLPDGRVLDVGAVHGGAPRKDWVLLGQPDMLITKKLGCTHIRPSVGNLYEGSNFKRYLEDVLPDEDVRRSLQEIVGYALLGEPEEKIIVLLHGPPDSGKTVLLEILEAMFGDYSGWTDGQALIAGKAKSAHTEWLNNIRGLRLVVTPETARGAKIDAAWMKSYTGREPQSSRGVYGDRTFSWKPTGIIFNASNHYVEYDAEDTAVAERTQVIEFEEQFLRGDPRRDDKLPSKIIEGELPVLLNWALEGLRRHGERKRDSGAGLDIAAKIVEWSRKYHTAQDHVGQFISDAVEEKKITPSDDAAPANCVPLKTMYALYRSWCKAQELKKPLGRNAFNNHLRQVYHWQSHASMGMRWVGYTAPYKDEADIMLVSW
jgi:putative DNA primase/helicase